MVLEQADKNVVVTEVETVNVSSDLGIDFGI